MHRYMLDDCTLRFALEPAPGFLIKAGSKGSNLLHPELEDMVALRAPREYGGDPEPFIPGSTLKGVVRSAAERLLRSLSTNRRKADRMACDPLANRGPCQGLADKLPRDAGEQQKAEVHARQCLACRTFGSRAIASRVKFTDAFSTRPTCSTSRSGVAIDRKTGGTSSGKLYDLEVVGAGAFQTAVHMDNVQLWQLALIGAVLRDIDDGLVRIGSAKTRGLGSFHVSGLELTWRQLGKGDRLRGAGEILGGERSSWYGLLEPDSLDCPEAGAEPTRHALGTGWKWTGDHAWAFLESLGHTPAWEAVASYGGAA